MPQCRALLTVFKVKEGFAFGLSCVFRGHSKRPFNRLSSRYNRKLATSLCNEFSLLYIERVGIVIVTVIVHRAANLGARSQAKRGIAEITFSDLIDQPRVEGGLRSYGFSTAYHLKCFCRGDKARQTHCTAATRNKAKVHFGKAQLRTVSDDTRVAAHRKLKPTTQYCAMQCGDPRFASSLNCIDDIGQMRFNRRFTKFCNIRPCDKGATRAR